MRRLALLIPVIAALAAAGSAPAARSLTARFALRITVKAPSGTLALAGSGVADAQKRVAVFTFGANGRSLQSIIHAGTDHLTVFTRGAAVQLRPGYLWARDDGSAAAPLVDPGLALRLRSSIGRSVGTARIGGTKTTAYAIRIGLPDAALLAPATPKSILKAGVPATLWVDGAGHVRRFHTVVPFSGGTAAIDETLSPSAAVVHLVEPSMKVVWDERMHDAWGLVVSALPDAEVYYANNVPGSTTDPNGNKNDRGYAGMTFEILKAKYESTLKPFTVVRSSSTSYCIEATANGVTVMKNGPAATIVEGRC